MDSLVQELGAVLKAKGWMLALAESCTGGMVAAKVTEVAGSSAWFDRGFVTYSNLAKMEMLHVAEAVLIDYGAVSEQTAEAMARGALRNSQACIAGAITGIAGPSGGSAEKPVGMVCFALAKYTQTTDFALAKDGKTTDFALAKHAETIDMDADVMTHQSTQFFKGDRQSVREQASQYLLTALLAWTTV